jgi:hypothetical protein
MASSSQVLFYLMQVSLQKWLGDKGNRDRSRVRIENIIVLYSAALLDWTAITKFKTNSEGFF